MKKLLPKLLASLVALASSCAALAYWYNITYAGPCVMLGWHTCPQGHPYCLVNTTGGMYLTCVGGTEYNYSEPFTTVCTWWDYHTFNGYTAEMSQAQPANNCLRQCGS